MAAAAAAAAAATVTAAAAIATIAERTERAYGAHVSNVDVESVALDILLNERERGTMYRPKIFQ